VTVTRSPSIDQAGSGLSAESAIADCSANRVKQSVGRFDDVWVTSYCDGNGASFIGIVTVTAANELNVSNIELDGHKIPSDGVEKLERNGSSHALLSGKVSDVLLVKVDCGLHSVTMLDRNSTQLVFVGCRHLHSARQRSSQNKQYGATTTSMTSSAVNTVPTGNTQSTKTYRIAARENFDVVANNSNRMTSTDTNSAFGGVSPMTSDSSSELNISESDVEVQYARSTTSLAAVGTTVGRNDSGHVINDVTGNNVMPCGVNGSSMNCVVARVSQTFNYSDSGSRPSSLELLLPNDVADAGEHFFHHVERTDPHRSDGLISSPTVIAVIASLAIAFFFVIACIVGFVVAELVCGKSSLQRVKVSPFVDDF